MRIAEQQVIDLARHFVGIRSELEKFFADPDNQKAYQEWYRKKYGHSVDEEVSV